MAPKLKKMKMMSLSQMLPNVLTLSALGVGLTSIKFALSFHFEKAVIAIMIAAVLDMLDGRVARMLGSASPLGAELDSLSDFISFGVAPAITLYLWALKPLGSIGWAAVLIFAMCGAFRLARFNLQSEVSEGEVSRHFTGVPIPAAAGLALMPLMGNLAFGDIFDFMRIPYVSLMLMPIVGLMMVSAVPTLSLKHQKISQKNVVPVYLTILILIVLLFTMPFATIFAVGIFYLASIPIVYRRAKKA